MDGTATPHWLFDILNEQVERRTGKRFQLDAAASGWNAKCPDYYDEETNALSRDWSDWDVVFCNPPYTANLIERFAEKALAAASQGTIVVLLLPSWPVSPWFQELKRQGELQEVLGQVRFEHHDGSEVVLNNGNNTIGIVVVTLGPKATPGTNGTPIRNPSRSEPGPDETRPVTAKDRATRPTLSRLSELARSRPSGCGTCVSPREN